MRLLYLGCHESLEYDDVKLFMELGCEVFTTGDFLNGSNVYRGEIKNLNINDDLKNEWLSLKEKSEDNRREIKMSSSFLDNFDVIFVIHSLDWITLNKDVLDGRNVVLRTIGQNLPYHEQLIKKHRNKFKIVRYSCAERRLPSYAGEDDLIRFYKDENEFKDWNGQSSDIINFTRHLNSRMDFCHGRILVKLAKEIGLKIYGDNNEIIESLNRGRLDYESLKLQMRNGRGYFYAGTKPASYTLNFMEAFMTGMPIVSIGSKLGQFMGLDLLEVSDIIKHGDSGFISNDYEEIKKYCIQLIEDKQMAEEISKNARTSAVEIFGKQKIKTKWKNFLGI